MRRLLLLACASMFSLLLAGCGQKTETAVAEQAPESMGPAETVAASAAQLRRGDLAAVLKTALPADKYERIRSQWQAKLKSEPTSEADKKEFAEMMAKFTAEGAEQSLYAEFEPQLAKLETEMAAQLPLMLGMGRGFLVQTLNESKELSSEQKQQATALIDALAKWLETANFFDRDKAKAAISKLVATARGLNIQTLDQVEALEFEAAMAKAGQLYLGVNEAMAVYGLDLNAALASVKTEVLDNQNDRAKVKVSYTLFEQPLSFETEMVRQDQRWFGRDALKEIEKQFALEAEEAPAAAAEAAGDAVEASETQAAE